MLKKKSLAEAIKTEEVKKNRKVLKISLIGTCFGLMIILILSCVIWFQVFEIKEIKQKLYISLAERSLENGHFIESIMYSLLSFDDEERPPILFRAVMANQEVYPAKDILTQGRYRPNTKAIDLNSSMYGGGFRLSKANELSDSSKLIDKLNLLGYDAIESFWDLKNLIETNPSIISGKNVDENLKKQLIWYKQLADTPCAGLGADIYEVSSEGGEKIGWHCYSYGKLDGGELELSPEGKWIIEDRVFQVDESIHRVIDGSWSNRLIHDVKNDCLVFNHAENLIAYRDENKVVVLEYISGQIETRKIFKANSCPKYFVDDTFLVTDTGKGLRVWELENRYGCFPNGENIHGIIEENDQAYSADKTLKAKLVVSDNGYGKPPTSNVLLMNNDTNTLIHTFYDIENEIINTNSGFNQAESIQFTKEDDALIIRGIYGSSTKIKFPLYGNKLIELALKSLPCWLNQEQDQYFLSDQSKVLCDEVKQRYLAP